MEFLKFKKIVVIIFERLLHRLISLTLHEKMNKVFFILEIFQKKLKTLLQENSQHL